MKKIILIIFLVVVGIWGFYLSIKETNSHKVGTFQFYMKQSGTGYLLNTRTGKMFELFKDDTGTLIINDDAILDFLEYRKIYHDINGVYLNELFIKEQN